MNIFRSPFDQNLTLMGKAKAFMVIWCQVMISFIVIGYFITIFTSEYKYARDFVSKHPKVVDIVGVNPNIILKPYTSSSHFAGGQGNAHHDFFVFGGKSNGRASVDLETQDGFWKIKSAIFIPDGGQHITLEQVFEK